MHEYLLIHHSLLLGKAGHDRTGRITGNATVRRASSKPAERVFISLSLIGGGGKDIRSNLNCMETPAATNASNIHEYTVKGYTSGIHSVRRFQLSPVNVYGLPTWETYEHMGEGDN